VVIVVVINPFFQINLQCLDSVIDLFAEHHQMELLQDGFVKQPLADAIVLRHPGQNSYD